MFQFFVLLLNTTIWIYAPELYPTRIARRFGVAFILAGGTAAGSLMPTVSGAVLEAMAFGGGLAACDDVRVFAVSIQFGPETYLGKSMEDANQPAETTGTEAAAISVVKPAWKPSTHMRRILLINPRSQ